MNYPAQFAVVWATNKVSIQARLARAKVDFKIVSKCLYTKSLKEGMSKKINKKINPHSRLIIWCKNSSVHSKSSSFLFKLVLCRVQKCQKG